MVVRLLALVAAFGLLVATPTLAQHSEAPPSGGSSVQGTPVPGSDQKQAGEDKKAATPAVPVLNPAETPQDQAAGRKGDGASDRIGANESGHESYERTIANFTIALAIATVMLAVVTGGLWWETRKLAGQAVEASKDTKRSIDIAERAAAETARAAQAAVDAVNAERAWVTFERPLTAISSTGTAPDGKTYHGAYGFSIGLINAGRSPAIRVGIALEHAIIKLGDEAPPFSPQIPEQARNGAFGPGRSGSSPQYWVYGDEYERFRKREIVIVLYCKVIYLFPGESTQDAVTEVCIMIGWNGENTGPNGEDAPNFDILTAGPQNTMT